MTTKFKVGDRVLVKSNLKEKVVERVEEGVTLDVYFFEDGTWSWESNLEKIP